MTIAVRVQSEADEVILGPILFLVLSLTHDLGTYIRVYGPTVWLAKTLVVPSAAAASHSGVSEGPGVYGLQLCQHVKGGATGCSSLLPPCHTAGRYG